jgi:ABC-type transport system involved in multi-copper enzyme maturation permease subunit
VNILWALTCNTVREAIRDRILTSILLFAGSVILTSLFMQELTIGDQDKVVRSISQGAIDVFGGVVAMFLGISLTRREIERRTVYTVLSKPVPRWAFVVGKWLGVWATVAIELALLMGVYTLLMLAQQGWPPGVVWVSMLTLLFKLGLVAAWSVLFATWLVPTEAAIYTIAVFVIGHLADDIWLFGSRSESQLLLQGSRLLYWLLPNFELFNLRELAVHERPTPWAQVGACLTYGLGYCAAVLSLAVTIFSRRDLK